MKKRNVIIVGAGPIGLETALRAARDGLDVTVLERGCVGDSIRKWGHVRFFTPLKMNSSELGRQAVQDLTNASAEAHEQQPTVFDDEILTGDQYCDRYLEPLARCDALKGNVLEHHEVVSVSRSTYGKSDRIGKSNRAAEPFRILVRNSNTEHILNSDVLIDCTGFTTRHRFIGAGGMPCPGELSTLSDRDYLTPDILRSERSRFAHQHTLVIGSGYSAATTVCLLADLAKDDDRTQVTWITRGDRQQPIAAVPNDPLPERVKLTEMANRLAHKGGRIQWLAGPYVESVSALPTGFDVGLLWSESDKGRVDRLSVNRIIANPGFRPNTDPFAELQIHRCYATDGPIRLAAHLLGETSGDCLQQSSGGPELLRNPEPDFYILGAASYGRDSRFLLQTGLQQIEDLFNELAAKESALA